MVRVDGIPTASGETLSAQPLKSIGLGSTGNADVAEVASAISCGNIHTPTERYGEMREVAAHTDAFVHGFACAAGGPRIGITEADLRVHEIANRLHTLATSGDHPEIRPGEIGEVVAVAIPALEK